MGSCRGAYAQPVNVTTFFAEEQEPGEKIGTDAPPRELKDFLIL
jgi:hypothetical protein